MNWSLANLEPVLLLREMLCSHELAPPSNLQNSNFIFVFHVFYLESWIWCWWLYSLVGLQWAKVKMSGHICLFVHLSFCVSFFLSVFLFGWRGTWVNVLITVWQCAPLHMRYILMPGTPLLVSTQAFHSDAMPILINLLDTYSNWCYVFDKFVHLTSLSSADTSDTLETK